MNSPEDLCFSLIVIYFKIGKILLTESVQAISLLPAYLLSNLSNIFPCAAIQCEDVDYPGTPVGIGASLDIFDSLWSHCFSCLISGGFAEIKLNNKHEQVAIIKQRALAHCFMRKCVSKVRQFAFSLATRPCSLHMVHPFVLDIYQVFGVRFIAEDIGCLISYFVQSELENWEFVVCLVESFGFLKNYFGLLVFLLSRCRLKVQMGGRTYRLMPI